jgi:hypothetical protein
MWQARLGVYGTHFALALFPKADKDYAQIGHAYRKMTKTEATADYTGLIHSVQMRRKLIRQSNALAPGISHSNPHSGIAFTWSRSEW